MITLEPITGNIIKISVPAKLKAEDFAPFSAQIDQIISQYGSIRLVVDAREFDGWENMQAFEKHMGFVKDHQKRVDRAALIPGHTWQHWVAGIFKMFVHPEVKIFNADEQALAIQWASE